MPAYREIVTIAAKLCPASLNCDESLNSAHGELFEPSLGERKLRPSAGGSGRSVIAISSPLGEFVEPRAQGGTQSFTVLSIPVLADVYILNF